MSSYVCIALDAPFVLPPLVFFTAQTPSRALQCVHFPEDTLVMYSSRGIY